MTCRVPAALLLAPLLAPAAQAAGLPDWARAIADSAPEYPAVSSEHRSRTLLSETRLRVERDGRVRVRRRVAKQALRVTASEVGVGFFHFDDNSQLLRSRAWHRPVEGKTTKSGGSSVIDLTLDDIFLTDSKTRFINIDGVDKGSLVFFEFEAIEQREDLAYLHFFQQDDPTDLSRLVLETPPDWTVRHAWLRVEGPGPTDEAGAMVWELRELIPVEQELLGEPPSYRVPLLAIGFDPPPGAKVKPVAMPDWTSIAVWFDDLARGRDDVTPPLEKLASDLAGTAENDTLARVRAAGNYVRDSVRYVAKDIGIGGYRPHHASHVLRVLYGDCKDKGTLFRALLAAVGQESYPVLINAALPETVSQEVPALTAFNHFVVGVPIAKETEVPAKFRPAIVESGDLGRLLVVDTTNEFTAIGSVPANLAGKTGLVVAGERSSLITLPSGDSEAHRIERRLDAEIGGVGELELRLETKRYGEPAATARAAYAGSAQEYRERVEGHVHDEWPEGTLEEFEVLVEADDGAFVEHCTVAVPPPDDTGSSDLLALFPRALEDLPRVSLRRRETPVVYDHAVTLLYESEIRGVAPLPLTPEERAESGEGWSVASELEPDGTTVHGSWRVELSRRHFDTDAFDELKEFWSSARRAARASVAVRTN